MKKWISLALTLALCLSLCACGKEPAVAKAPKDAKAAEVFTQIKGLYNVDLTSDEAIKAAEAAYEALTQKQKAAVSNYNDLKAARNKYDRLLNVFTLIENIGTVTQDSEAAILAAEEAFDLLPEIEHRLITNAEKLTAARAAFDAIETVVTLDAELFEYYFFIENITTVTKTGSTGNYGTKITGNIRVTPDAMVKSTENVTATIRVHYTVGRTNNGTMEYTQGSRDVVIHISESDSTGSAPFNPDVFVGKEGYPVFELKSYEVISASGTVTQIKGDS